MPFRSKTFRFVALALFLLFSISAFRTADWYFEVAKNLKIYTSLLDEVNQYYVEEVSAGQLVQASIKAMLKELDPYTVYYSEDDIEDYRRENTDSYASIGAEGRLIHGKFFVTKVMKDQAADQAGLKVGDELISVDGQPLQGLDMDQIAKLVRGQMGTVAKITYRRPGQAQPATLEVGRVKVEATSVSYSGMVSKGIGMIRLEEFTRACSQDLRKAMKKLEKEGMEKLIIDLRGNPGGLLMEAVEICNFFIPKRSSVVSTRGKMNRWNNEYKAQKDPISPDMPIAVLINGNSASASEIVSGVLQDYDRGVLIGQPSFGKGLVQATRDLPYNAKLKVTVAKYYIPSGRCIQAIDYATRDKDGNPIALPDSLKKTFMTMGGREVSDGAGIDPDITIAQGENASITQALLDEGYIFEYATEYVKEHDQIKSVADIQLTDADYQKFIDFIENSDFKYQTDLEKKKKELEALPSAQQPSIKAILASLEAEIQKLKAEAYAKYKREIIREIRQDIAQRFFYEEGRVAAALDGDLYVSTAIATLNDQTKYAKVLKSK